MSPAFQRDRFTWLAYSMLAFYGYFLNVLGPITPFLKNELSLTYTVSSLHFTAFAVGILLVGLGGHLVIERLGRWGSLWLGALGMSAGALFLIAGQTPWLTIGASFIMGLVGSLILAIVPSALADQHGAFRAVALSEANVLASLVSTAAPLMVGWFAGSIAGWRTALALFAIVPLFLWLVFAKARPPGSDPHVRSASPAAGAKNQPLPFIFWVYWFSIVLAVSAEFCMIFWSADYMENSLDMPKAEAAQAVALYLGGMILGRLASSRLVQRFSVNRVIAASLVVAGLGFLLFWTASSILAGAVGLALTGLGIAGLYPLTLSLTIGSAGAKTVQAGARATLASGTAILTLPLVLGSLADQVGIRQAYSVVILLLAGVFAVIQLARRLSLARTPAS